MNRSLRRAHAFAIPCLAGASLILGIVARTGAPDRASLNDGLSPTIESLTRSEPTEPGVAVLERARDGLELVIERTRDVQRLRVTADARFQVSDCLIYAVTDSVQAVADRDRFEHARLLGVVRPGSPQVFALRQDERSAFAYGLIERNTVLAIEIPKTEEQR